MGQLLPGTTATPVKRTTLGDVAAAGLRASTRQRSLRVEEPMVAVRSLAAALAQVRGDEQLIVQVVLGPRRIPMAVATNSPSSVVAPWWNVAWHGNGKTIDSEKRTALRAKVGDHGFACAIRFGVVAGTAKRRAALLLGLLAALRTSESAGLRLRLASEQSSRLRFATTPWRWPLRLNVQELLGLIGWPLGGDDLPGYGAVHPKRLPPGTWHDRAISGGCGLACCLGLSRWRWMPALASTICTSSDPPAPVRARCSATSSAKTLTTAEPWWSDRAQGRPGGRCPRSCASSPRRRHRAARSDRLGANRAEPPAQPESGCSESHGGAGCRLCPGSLQAALWRGDWAAQRRHLARRSADAGATPGRLAGHAAATPDKRGLPPFNCRDGQ